MEAQCGSVSVLFKKNDKPPYSKEEIKMMEKKRKAMLKELQKEKKEKDRVKSKSNWFFWK